MIINVAQLRVWAQRAAGAFAECPSFIHSGVPSLETGDRGGEDPAWSLRKRSHCDYGKRKGDRSGRGGRARRRQGELWAGGGVEEGPASYDPQAKMQPPAFVKTVLLE